MKFFKYSLRVLLPLAVLVISFFIARQIISGKKKVKLHAAPPVVSVVEAEPAVKSEFRVVVKSYGTVRARTESAVVPEVSGTVVEISPNFRAGGFLDKGELILGLDPRNYEIEVALKEAELAKASQLLLEEEARAAIALRNWERLRGERTPTPLAAREPQLMSARAEFRAARAKLDRAELDLERTRILAPYSGRVLEKSVDLGEYVIAGNAAARIYAVDFVEIRLPLSARELEFVDIQGLGRWEAAQKTGEALRRGPAAEIIAVHRGKEYKWSARIVRSEGTIDEKSRQLFVVAEVSDPYGKKSSAARSGYFSAPPLKVGEFVEARIQGRLLRGVYVIPRRALREGAEVFIIKDGLLERRAVNVVWKDADNIVIDSGLKEGELVVTTPAVYMKAGKFKVVPAPSAVPAGRHSPATGDKPKQGKVITDKVAPAGKLKLPAKGQSPTTGDKPKQSKVITDKVAPAGKLKLSAKGQSPTTGNKPKQSKWALDKVIPITKPTSPKLPAKSQSPATGDKPKQGKTTLGITLPLEKPPSFQSGKALKVKGSSEASGWFIPAFDEKDQEDKEVVR